MKLTKNLEYSFLGFMGIVDKYVPSKFICGRYSLQCNGIKRRNLWEMTGTSALIKQTSESFPHPFHHVVDHTEVQQSVTQKKALIRTQPTP